MRQAWTCEAESSRGLPRAGPGRLARLSTWTVHVLELNAACGGPKEAELLGVDVDIRAKIGGRSKRSRCFDAFR